MRRIWTSLLLVLIVAAMAQPAWAQDSTPVAETVTPTIEASSTPRPEPTATPTPEPTQTPMATPAATEEPVVPAAASPTSVPSGVVDNGDGSYTLTANPGDIADLDLSSLLPSGGMYFQQIVSLSATIVSVEGPCYEYSPVFYLNQFVPSPPTQGILVEIGDPANNFACSTGPTGNLIQSGPRFGQYHTDQSGGPAVGYGFDYNTALAVLHGSILTGMKFRLENDGGGTETQSVTIRDIAITVAPLADLTVTVNLCQTSDPDALARQVDYALAAFEPAAAVACTALDPTGIPITTSLLDANGDTFGSFNAVAQSDGSVSPAPNPGSATSLQFSEGFFGTTSEPLAIPSGGGGTAAITIYTTGEPGSITLRSVNAFGRGGLQGATFALYRTNCTGTPLMTGTTDSNGDLTFSIVADGTYCVANLAGAPGFPLIDPVTGVVVSAGSAVDLGELPVQSPPGPVKIKFIDGNTIKPVPGVCAALYRSAGYPDGTPSGLITATQCDDDGDGSVVLNAPLEVTFEVVMVSGPLDYLVGPPVQDIVTADDLPNGVTASQYLSGGNTGAVLTLVAQHCTVSDPAEAGTTITVLPDTTTQLAATECTPLDASFSFVPFGLESAYPPLTMTTVAGTVTRSDLPWTGDEVGTWRPNTFHALVDNLRPGASGESASFDLPDSGARIIVITVSEVPGTPTPTVTATATVTPEPTQPAPTPTPSGTVVALPNTGSGSSGGETGWLYAALLMLTITALGLAGRAARRSH
jgi:hypothetical protein